jgi:hypothetical protein
MSARMHSNNICFHSCYVLSEDGTSLFVGVVCCSVYLREEKLSVNVVAFPPLLQTLFFVRLTSLETRKVLEQIINYVIYKVISLCQFYDHAWFVRVLLALD